MNNFLFSKMIADNQTENLQLQLQKKPTFNKPGEMFDRRYHLLGDCHLTQPKVPLGWVLVVLVAH